MRYSGQVGSYHYTTSHPSLLRLRLSLVVEYSGIDHRLVTPYHPRANGVAEKWVHTAKSVIVKRLQGKKEDWDLYVPSAQLAINSKISQLHKSRPFALMSARQPNEFKDYTQDDIGTTQDITNELEQRLKQMDTIVIPAISERAKTVYQAQQGKFNDKNCIVPDFPTSSKVMIPNVNRKSKTDPRYEGPFTVHGKNKGNSYVLTDETGALL